MLAATDPTSFDPTTLVTFIFRAHPGVHTVELLGSWDNFHLPYRMHHDRRRGVGFWSGCFKFENIFLDGDGYQWTKPRSGGLRQGGTYWYYYRLNYDVDAVDDRQPHTTSCPLLPGQQVNVIDVPIEVVEPIKRCHSAYADIVGSLADYGESHTMNPESKFASLNPPPVSKVHTRCQSDDALDRRQHDRSTPSTGRTVSPVSPVRSPRAPSASANSKPSRQRAASRASSLYPERSVQMANNAVGDDFERNQSLDTITLPSFPYPDQLGPAPLDSLETLAPGLVSLSEEELVPPSDAAEQVAMPAHQGHRKKASENSLGPISVRNVQFYGSRPGTNLTSDPEQHRPRMYSLPNLEIVERSSRSPSRPASRESDYSPRDPDENLTPADDGVGYYDLISPTFSAATVSTGGHSTPFRLSAQNSITGGTYIPSGADGHSLGDVAERLRALNVAQPTSGPRSSFDVTRKPLATHTFVNYSLPTIASESNQSLAKTISALPAQSPRGSHDITLPQSLIYKEGEGRSMAEDIFEELGFLSDVIA